LLLLSFHKCLDPSEERVYISRDVIFDEQVFSFTSMQLNVGAQLWSELALLPDLFDLSSSFGYSSLPDQSIVSSFLANPSQRSAPNCVLSGEDSGTNDGNFALESVDQG
jgi:hypothetical protein